MHLEACAPVSADVSSICLVLVSSAEESRFKSRAYSCVMRRGTAWYIYLPASLKSCALDVCHVLTCMCAWCSGQFAALTGKGVQEGACRAARHAAAAARLVGCLAGGLRARPEALGSAAHALPGLPAAVQEADAPEVALAGGECPQAAAVSSSTDTRYVDPSSDSLHNSQRMHQSDLVQLLKWQLPFLI